MRFESGYWNRAGIRPAVVVQIDRANTASPHTIIVPFTTKIRQVLFPSHALVPAGKGGLSQDSVALCEQVRVIDIRRVVKSLGRLESTDFAKIESALRTILGL
jgi:mRNA interferase MazF